MSEVKFEIDYKDTENIIWCKLYVNTPHLPPLSTPLTWILSLDYISSSGRLIFKRNRDYIWAFIPDLEVLYIITAYYF